MKARERKEFCHMKKSDCTSQHGLQLLLLSTLARTRIIVSLLKGKLVEPKQLICPEMQVGDWDLCFQESLLPSAGSGSHGKTSTIPHPVPLPTSAFAVLHGACAFQGMKSSPDFHNNAPLSPTSVKHCDWHNKEAQVAALASQPQVFLTELTGYASYKWGS